MYEPDPHKWPLCHICHVSFASFEALRNHLINHHKITDETQLPHVRMDLRCLICPTNLHAENILESETELIAHIKICHPYHCVICGEKCGDEEHLLDHEFKFNHHV